MGCTKAGLITVAFLIFPVVFCLNARSEGSKDQSRPYEYTGVIKAKGEGTHTLKVQTQTGAMNFHYQRHGKKQCAGFKELAVGDTIKVRASDHTSVSEATCIIKLK